MRLKLNLSLAIVLLFLSAIPALAKSPKPERPPQKAFGVMLKLKDQKSGETREISALNTRFGVTGKAKFFKDFNIYSFRLKNGPTEDHQELKRYCEEARKLPGVVYCELNLELRPDSI